MSEVYEAMQIARVMVEIGGKSIPLVFKLGVGTVSTLKNVIAFLIKGAKEHFFGYRTNYGKMLEQYGPNLKVLQFREEDMKKVKEYLKKYKIPYVDVPDLNLNDGLVQIMFPADAIDRVNAMLERTKLNTNVMDMGEYVSSADPERMKEILKEVKEDLARNGKEITEEVKVELSSMSKIAEYQNNMANIDRERIEVKAEDIISVEDDYIVIQLPGIEQEVAIDKKGLYITEQGDVLMFVDRQKDYPIMNQYGEVTSKLTGNQIKEQYYDPIKSPRFKKKRERIKQENYLNELEKEIKRKTKQYTVAEHIAQGIEKEKQREKEKEYESMQQREKEERIVAREKEYPIEAYRDMLDNKEVTQIEIHKDNIIAMDKTSVVVKIPGTENYILVNKEGGHQMENDNLLLFIEKEKNYSIMDANGKKVKDLKGKNIGKTFEKELSNLYASQEKMEERNNYLKSLERPDSDIKKWKAGQDRKDNTKQTQKETVIDSNEVGINQKMILQVDNISYQGFNIEKYQGKIPDGSVYITRVPGSNPQSFIKLEKDEILGIKDEGKTLSAKLNLNKEYILYNKEGKPIGRKKGKDLKTEHYSKVAKTTKQVSVKQKQNTSKKTINSMKKKKEIKR